MPWTLRILQYIVRTGSELLSKVSFKNRVSNETELVSSSRDSREGTNLSISGTFPPLNLVDFLNGKISFSLFNYCVIYVTRTSVAPRHHLVLVRILAE